MARPSITGPTCSRLQGPERSGWARLLGAAWLLLLLAPNLALAARVNTWQMPAWAPVAAGAWLVLALWVLLPRRVLLVASYPVVLAGVVVVVADRLRSADALAMDSSRIAGTVPAAATVRAL